MKLDDNFYIENEGENFILIRLVDGYKMAEDKKGRIPVKNKQKSYYGCLYQALQNYLVLSVDECKNLSDIQKRVVDCIRVLSEAKKQIKEEFSTVVRKQV